MFIVDLHKNTLVFRSTIEYLSSAQVPYKCLKKFMRKGRGMKTKLFIYLKSYTRFENRLIDWMKDGVIKRAVN